MLISLKDAAVQLGISVITLRRHIAYKDISFVNVGHGTIRPKIMFRQEDIDRFVASRLTVARDQTFGGWPKPRRQADRPSVEYTVIEEFRADSLLRRKLYDAGWRRRRKTQNWYNMRTKEQWVDPMGQDGYPPLPE